MTTRLWRAVALSAVASTLAVMPARAQEITPDLVDRFINAFTTEQAELEKLGPQVAEIDEKIKKFKECKELYEAAGEVSGSRLGGLAAKAAMKAKCGATSDEGYYKDKAKLYSGPEKAALAAGKFKSSEYSQLKEKLGSWAAGSHSGYKPAELEALAARKDDLSKLFGAIAAAQNTGGNSGRGMKGAGAMGLMAGGWTMDYAWGFIGQMFGLMFMSGVTMLEEPFQPGEFAIYEVTQTGEDQKLVFERAFLGTTKDGGEWWRMKYVITEGQKADTVNLEALMKPVGDAVKQVVRMKGKLPGNKEAQELMVPQHLTMLTSLFQLKPTKESIEGATIGTETVAGASAKHVKFGGGNGGNLEWWMTPSVPGGVARFRVTNQGDDGKPETWTMEMTKHGKNAKSELGVM